MQSEERSPKIFKRTSAMSTEVHEKAPRVHKSFSKSSLLGQKLEEKKVAIYGPLDSFP